MKFITANLWAHTDRDIASRFSRNALAILVSASFFSALATPSSAKALTPDARSSQPNIIFLLTDDQRADSLSISGHPEVKTPSIDSLAMQGVQFSNAYTVQPICAPSRFAFFSGQYERVSGLGFNSPYQVSELQWANTYPALLRKAGYHTGFIGKFGVQYYELKGGAAAKFDYWRAHDGWLPFFPKDLPGNPATPIYKEAKNDISTEIMGEYIDDFLTRRPRDKPFSLSVSFSAPHHSLVSSMYPDGANSIANCESYECRIMGYPANGNPRLKGHPIYDNLYRDSPLSVAVDTGQNPYRFLPRGVIDHEARKQSYAYNYDPTLQREHLTRYYQTITGVDRVVGQLLKKLRNEGLLNNTVIIFSSDHGVLNGEYGTGGKALLYDHSAKIPLIVFDPRSPAVAKPEVVEDLVLSIDVPVTILAYAGIDTPSAMKGRKLNVNQKPREEIFLESLTVAEGNPFIEALRTPNWKYVRYFKARACPYKEEDLKFSDTAPIFEQLFHMQNDPQERLNLVDDPQHSPQLDILRARISDHSLQLTERGRIFKEAQSVPRRPSEGVYCW